MTVIDQIVLVDFAGTLIRKEILDEANQYRSDLLKRALPPAQEHAHSETLYKDNRAFVELLTGLLANAQVQFREKRNSRRIITGEEVQNMIATTLFQVGMYMAAKKHGLGIFQEGMLDELQRIKKAGYRRYYKLAIVSGVREDIITGMFAIAKLPLSFDYIYGQPPSLGVSNDENLYDLEHDGDIAFVIGDKMSDLQVRTRISSTQPKKIFVTWGHPTGGEEAFADYTISHPRELQDIIK